VGAYPEGVSAWGVHELVGNGWEWTDTPFTGLPGFTAWIPEYTGYSADFFDGKHFVLKGASWATAAELVRRSFRNWYQAHYPYVFAKFRCVSTT
jgi:formylglycine-generating enzyme required for sulfatase activity